MIKAALDFSPFKRLAELRGRCKNCPCVFGLRFHQNIDVFGRARLRVLVTA
jgi:hypothetical protein